MTTELLIERIVQSLSEVALLRNAVATIVLILAVLLVRTLLLRAVRRTKWASDQNALRWAVQVRWISLGIILFGLVIVWASELRELALSIVAIAAAVVIATKELILCVSGALVRASAESFQVGDRIEVDGVRGDVIDHRPLTTTILEIGPSHQRTGRVVVVPNSVFVTGRVFNETFTNDFVLHSMTIPLKIHDDLQAVQSKLMEIAQTVCGPYMDDARRQLDAIAKEHGLPVFSVAPKVILRIPEPEVVSLLLRVPTPARERDHVEQRILQQYLAWRRTDLPLPPSS